MPDVITEIRAAVKRKFGTFKAFADAIGQSEATVNNWWRRGSIPHGHRPRVSEVTGVPYRHLVPDAPSDAGATEASEISAHLSQVREEVEALYAASPINVEQLAAAIVLVQRLCTKKGVRPSAEKKAMLIARVYADGIKSEASRIVEDWISRETLTK